MTTATMTTDAAAQSALAAARDIHALAAEFVDVMQEAGRLAAALADAEARHRVALGQAGVQHCHRPPARELAADVALGYLAPLAPYLQQMSTEGRDRAAKSLTTLPCAALPAPLELPTTS